MLILLSSDPGAIQLIFGALCLPVVIYLFSLVYSYLFSGISKVTGRSLSYRGKIVATPDTLGMLNSDVKDKFKRITNGLTKLYYLTNQTPDTEKLQKVKDAISTNDKIKQLKELGELKANGTITEEEFNVIKKELIT